MADITSETIASYRFVETDDGFKRSGALLTRPLYATAEVRITKKADPASIKLLLDYDTRSRLRSKLQ
jgi:hypothetical protein